MAGGVPPRPKREEALSLAPVLSEAVRRLHMDVMARAQELLPGDGVARVGGGGIEVAGVREYHPGDEVRGIDWRVTARRGRIHVKVFAPEKDQSVLLVLDRSAAQRGGRGSIQEIRALETTSLLAAVAVKEGYRVGLLQATGGGAELLAPGRGRNHLPLLLTRLLEGGVEPGEGILRDLLEAARVGLRERTRVFLVGELSVGPAELPACRSALQDLAHRHMVTAIPVRDRMEGDFPSLGSLLLRDPASGRVALIRTPDPRREEEPVTGEEPDAGGDGSERVGLLRELGSAVHPVEVQDPLLPQLRALLDGGGNRRWRSA